MKFFLPAAKNDEEAESAYSGIKRFMIEHHHHQVSDARIREITFTRDGKRTTDTVGEISPSNGEHVIAIFDAESMYLVCTFNRGVARGGPMLTGKWQTQHVEFFDPPTP